MTTHSNQQLLTQEFLLDNPLIALEAEDTYQHPVQLTTGMVRRLQSLRNIYASELAELVLAATEDGLREQFGRIRELRGKLDLLKDILEHCEFPAIALMEPAIPVVTENIGL